MSSVVPEGWSYSKISEIGTVVTGSTPSTTESSYWGGAIPFVSPADFDGTVYVRQTGRTVTERGAQKGRILPKDSILVTCIGSLGGIAISSEISVTNQQINAIVPSNENDNRFTYYNVLFHIDELEKNAGTTTLPIINKSTFGSITLPIPPLPEQKKIASILTSVDEVIENTQKQIDKLQDLKKATMNELLTKGIGHTEFKDSELGRIPKSWEVTSVGQYSKSIVPGRNKPASLNGKIPWITITDLEKFSVSKSKQNLGVDRNILKSAGGKTVPARSVILSVVGEFGISSLAEVELVINQQLHGFVCDAELHPEFLCFSIRHAKLQLERLSTQTTISYLNKENVETLNIVLPPLEEQYVIAEILQSIMHQQETLEQKLSQTQSLKKSLMQDLLTGKVRVTVN